MRRKRRRNRTLMLFDCITEGFRKAGRIKVAFFAVFLFMMGLVRAHAGEYQWPAYSPNVAYDYTSDHAPLDKPTKILPGVSGVQGVYANDWWCFVWGTNANPQVSDKAWIPMIKRFNKDFSFISDVMGWPRDVRAQNGYYSTVYLFGSGLSTDNASNTDPGGWMGTTGWNGKPWHCVLASYIPVCAFDPATPDGYQEGAIIHEGIHAVFAPLTGGNNSAWAQESFNTWLQGTMASLRSGSFSGMGGLSVGSVIAPFIPIQCYSGWLQDGSFGGPNGQGVNMSTNINGTVQQVCTWRQTLGGYQYSEAFPHAMEVILGPRSVPWMWNSSYSGNLLENLGQAPGGLGDAQTRRLIQEYRGREAFCDFKQWSYAYRQLLNTYWGQAVQQEWSPYEQAVEPWVMTCYVATTNNAGTLTPEARTLPGWSGANEVPLTIDPSATSVSVDFTPLGANMSCQLTYRDTSGKVHYSDPVNSGTCSMPVTNVLNNVIVAVVCNSDYIYVDDTTRTTKYDYRLTMGTGITGQADIYTKWYDWNPATFTITSSAGAHGTIFPAGAVVADNGSVQTFTFSPDPGYKVGQVYVNGQPAGAPTSYTLNPVLSDIDLQVTFQDATPPAAPTGLSATASNGSIILNWSANGESDLAGYAVYRSTTSGSDYVVITNGLTTSTCTDSNMVAGTTYYYVVKAIDTTANASAYSTEASAVAVDTLAPAAPTGLTVKGVGTAATLDWADNTEPDLASYTVYRSTTSGSGYVAVTNGLTDSIYTDDSLIPGTTYYYVVTAVDASSNESASSSEATPENALLVHWDFNDPSLGAADGVPMPDSSSYNVWNPAAYDKSGNGNDLTTWNYAAGAGFIWSTNSVDGDFSMKSAGDYPAAFTWSSQSAPSGTDVETFTGSSFTVEALATVASSNYTRTVVGRDAENIIASGDSGLSALYLGLDSGNHARFSYIDVNGQIVELASHTTYTADDHVFHHFAGTTDGSTVSLYVDGALVAQSSGNHMGGLAIGTTSGSGWHAGGWSVGRGLYGGNHSDRWYGYIDAVSIEATMLKPGAFVLSKTIAPGDPAPAAPTGLLATARDASVDLDWNDNTEPDFKYYTVYRGTAGSGIYAPIRLGLTNSVYTDPVADNGTTYSYVITATDMAGNESVYSASASATPFDVTPPAAPTGLVATPGNASVTLDWNDNTDSDFVSYTLYRSTTSGGGYVAIASGLTTSAYRDSTVGNGVTYYYVVTALDTSSLESSNSAEATATPTAKSLVTGTIIGTPGSWDGVSTITNVFDGDLNTYYDAVNASGDWAGLDLGSAQSIVSVQYCPRVGWASRMVGGMFQGSDTVDFSANVVTLFTVTNTPLEGVMTEQAISDAGTYRYVRYIGPDGGYCNVSEVKFYASSATDTTPPAAPTGLVATANAGSVSLDWADNTEPDLARYTVYRSVTSGSGYTAVGSWLTSSSYTDSSVVNGTTYYYVVTATDTSLNESSNSVEVSATPQAAVPPAPIGLSAAAVSASQIDLSWTASEGATSYTVKRAGTSGGPYTTIASGVSSTGYSDSGLTAGTTYYYVVSAENTSGSSANSSEASATTQSGAPTAPAAPTALNATAASFNQIDLSWTASSGADSYNVKWAANSGGPYTTAASGVTGTSYSDIGLLAGSTNYYVVSAVNAGGESADSAQASAVTPTLVAYLPFDETSGTTAHDASSNGFDGTLVNGPVWATGIITNSVLLNGASQYVSLPTGVVGYVGNFTISTWVYLNANTMWSRVFDFGSGTTTNMFLTPQANSGNVRFAITTGGNASEQDIDGTSALPTNVWTHVAITRSGNTGILYVDGVAVGTNTTMTLYPAMLGDTTLNYIGKSQYPDPYLNGAVDDFRVIGRALSASEIATLATPPADTTAPAAPSGLSATAGDGSVSLDWADNTEPDLASYTVYRSTTSGSGYSVIASGLTVSAYTDNSAVNGTTYYYMVTATDTSSNESAASIEVSATPASAGNATLMHVDAITVTTVNASRGSKTGQASVTILDGTGSPVSGATVSGTFTGSYNESRSGVTDGSGTAVVNTTASAKGGVSFTFTVSNVTESSHTYDAAANVVNSATY